MTIAADHSFLFPTTAAAPASQTHDRNTPGTVTLTAIGQGNKGGTAGHSVPGDSAGYGSAGHGDNTHSAWLQLQEQSFTACARLSRHILKCCQQQNFTAATYKSIRQNYEPLRVLNAAPHYELLLFEVLRHQYLLRLHLRRHRRSLQAVPTEVRPTAPVKTALVPAVSAFTETTTASAAIAEQIEHELCAHLGARQQDGPRFESALSWTQQEEYLIGSSSRLRSTFGANYLMMLLCLYQGLSAEALYFGSFARCYGASARTRFQTVPALTSSSSTPSSACSLILNPDTGLPPFIFNSCLKQFELLWSYLDLLQLPLPHNLQAVTAQSKAPKAALKCSLSRDTAADTAAVTAPLKLRRKTTAPNNATTAADTSSAASVPAAAPTAPDTIAPADTAVAAGAYIHENSRAMLLNCGASGQKAAVWNSQEQVLSGYPEKMTATMKTLYYKFDRRSIMERLDILMPETLKQLRRLQQYLQKDLDAKDKLKKLALLRTYQPLNPQVAELAPLRFHYLKKNARLPADPVNEKLEHKLCRLFCYDYPQILPALRIMLDVPRSVRQQKICLNLLQLGAPNTMRTMMCELFTRHLAALLRQDNLNTDIRWLDPDPGSEPALSAPAASDSSAATTSAAATGGIAPGSTTPVTAASAAPAAATAAAAKLTVPTAYAVNSTTRLKTMAPDPLARVPVSTAGSIPLALSQQSKGSLNFTLCASQQRTTLSLTHPQDRALLCQQLQLLNQLAPDIPLLRTDIYQGSTRYVALDQEYLRLTRLQLLQQLHANQSQCQRSLPTQAQAQSQELAQTPLIPDDFSDEAEHQNYAHTPDGYLPAMLPPDNNTGKLWQQFSLKLQLSDNTWYQDYDLSADCTQATNQAKNYSVPTTGSEQSNFTLSSCSDTCCTLAHNTRAAGAPNSHSPVHRTHAVCPDTTATVSAAISGSTLAAPAAATTISTGAQAEQATTDKTDQKTTVKVDKTTAQDNEATAADTPGTAHTYTTADTGAVAQDKGKKVTTTLAHDSAVSYFAPCEVICFTAFEDILAQAPASLKKSLTEVLRQEFKFHCSVADSLSRTHCPSDSCLSAPYSARDNGHLTPAVASLSTRLELALDQEQSTERAPAALTLAGAAGLGTGFLIFNAHDFAPGNLPGYVSRKYYSKTSFETAAAALSTVLASGHIAEVTGHSMGITCCYLDLVVFKPERLLPALTDWLRHWRKNRLSALSYQPGCPQLTPLDLIVPTTSVPTDTRETAPLTALTSQTAPTAATTKASQTEKQNVPPSNTSYPTQERCIRELVYCQAALCAGNIRNIPSPAEITAVLDGHKYSPESRPLSGIPVDIESTAAAASTPKRTILHLRKKTTTGTINQPRKSVTGIDDTVAVPPAYYTVTTTSEHGISSAPVSISRGSDIKPQQHKDAAINCIKPTGAENNCSKLRLKTTTSSAPADSNSSKTISTNTKGRLSLRRKLPAETPSSLHAATDHLADHYRNKNSSVSDQAQAQVSVQVREPKMRVGRQASSDLAHNRHGNKADCLGTQMEQPHHPLTQQHKTSVPLQSLPPKTKRQEQSQAVMPPARTPSRQQQRQEQLQPGQRQRPQRLSLRKSK